MAVDVKVLFEEISLLLRLEDPWRPEVNSELDLLTLRLPTNIGNFLNDVPNIQVLDDVKGGQWLISLCSRLIRAKEVLEDIASVTHLAIIRAAVSKLVKCSILPNLSCELPYSSLSSSTNSNLSPEEKCAIVEICTRVMVLLLSNGHTQGAVLRHYGELLGALISLHSISSTKTVKSAVESTLPVEINCNRQYYKETVTKLLDEIHQPTVFTHLMILISTKGDGGKVSRVACKVLESKVQKPGGVSALLTATILSDQSPPSTLAIMKVSSLLSGKHSPDFYQAVFPQVLALLVQQTDVRGHQVAANCILLLSERDSALCEKYFLAPLLAPFETPCGEGDIDASITAISHWVHAAPPNASLSRPLPLLCVLYASIIDTTSSLKPALSDLLLACFNRLQHPCPYILSCLFPTQPDIIYALTSSCSVVSKSSNKPLPPEITSKVLLDFISTKKLSKVKVDLYRSLLRYVVGEQTRFDHKFIATELLTDLSSDPSVLESLSAEPRYLIDFLMDLFTKENFHSESVSLGLVLLTVFLGDNLVHKKANWQAIAKLEQPLLRLEKSSELEIKSLASEILSRLNDLGIVKSEIENKNLDSAFVQEDCKAKPIPTRGRVESGDYAAAIEESTDPHLPVRAHALRTLSKLLLANDKTTMNNKTTLLHLFKINLDDSDSYLYLSAIEGLSNLASAFPDDIINTLCEEFTSRQNKPELRLKIGQILVKTTNLLGEKTTVYKKELIDTFLIGISDSDPLVRASSLSNIGEIAKILSYRIYDFLMEILDTVERVVDTEKELEPKRAAVMLIHLLLQGLGKDTFSVLEEVLLQLYRKLKFIYQTDKDDITRLHAQLALEQLADTTRSLIFSHPSLINRISILDINE